MLPREPSNAAAHLRVVGNHEGPHPVSLDGQGPWNDRQACQARASHGCHSEWIKATPEAGFDPALLPAQPHLPHLWDPGERGQE